MNYTLLEFAPAGTAPVETPAPASAAPKVATETTGLPEVRGRIPSWVISLVGHLLVLVALWPIHFATMLFREPEVTASVTAEETFSTIPQELRFDTAAAPEIGNGGDNTSETSLRVAHLGSTIETPKSPVVSAAARSPRSE